MQRFMFTIFDRVYSTVRHFRSSKVSSSLEGGRETIVSEGNSDRTLVAFLPSILMAGRYLGNQILSEAKKRELSVIAREISQSTVQPTPQGTRNAMDAVYSAVSEKVCSLSLNPENTLVLGESIGCCHASRFAAELGTKRLILALPGSK